MSKNNKKEIKTKEIRNNIELMTKLVKTKTNTNILKENEILKKSGVSRDNHNALSTEKKYVKTQESQIIKNIDFSNKDKDVLNKTKITEEMPKKYDVATFKAIINIAKGKMTTKDFFNKCGINFNYDSVVPSEIILRTIAAHAENGVSYEELKLSLSGKVYAGRNFSYKNDAEKAIKLLKKAMGNKSISQFSAETSISRRIISLILNKRIDIVTPKIIEKIGAFLSEEDKNELYSAFGYPNQNNSFAAKEDKTIIPAKLKIIKIKKNTSTSTVAKNSNSNNYLTPSTVVCFVKEFEEISDLRWNIFKKDIFNKFFNMYNYQQINQIVPMSQSDYYELRENDRTQIKMSYQKYKRYVIKLTSLPLCKQSAMEMLSYLRLDSESPSPLWKYKNYLDVIFIDESVRDIATKVGISTNTINAFKYKISDKSIKALCSAYNTISENELTKLATEAGVFVSYRERFTKPKIRKKLKNKLINKN